MTEPQLEMFGVITRTAFNLISFAFVWHFMIKANLRDEFRHRLFSLRREMFRCMMWGHISPEHAAYRKLESTINALISFADRLTPIRLCINILAFRKAASNYTVRLEQLLHDVPDPVVREKIAAYDRKISAEIRRYISSRNPVSWSLFRLCHRVRRLLNRPVENRPAFVRSVEAEAVLSTSCYSPSSSAFEPMPA